MKLFRCDTARIEAVPEPNVISTPLGNVRLNVSVRGLDGRVFDEVAPLTTFRLLEGGRIVSWQHPDFDLELLVCRPQFPQPVEFPVTDCWGALWRAKAKATTGPFVFSAVWDAEHQWETFDFNSGENLYAHFWEDERFGVTIGTQDDEMLSLRVRRNELPPQWEAYFRFRHPALPINSLWVGDVAKADQEGKGISNPLPPLKAGQSFQIPFAVAWAAIGDDAAFSALATSLTVEATPSEILAGGGCS